MPRRRPHTGLVVVDLTAAEAVAAPAGARDEGAPPAGPPMRRQAVVGLVVLALLVGVWAVATTVRTREHDARLAAAPGGVPTLERAPDELWSAATDAPGEVLTLPGVVVVRRGTELVGLDTRTGTERWAVQTGDHPRCGPTGGAAHRLPDTGDRLVCWSGPGADPPSVVVIGADGATASRDLPAGLDAVAPGSDGVLVTARVAGDGDALVRAEDAATGTELWSREVASRTVGDIRTCAEFTSRTGEDDETAVTTLQLLTYPSLVTLDGCGLHAALAADGTPVTDPPLSSWSTAQPYLDGGVLERVGAYGPDAGADALLHRPDGAVETLDEVVLVPWATDGRVSDVRLTGGYAQPLRALGPDGAERWRTEDLVPDVLVRAGGVLLVARADGTAAGVELATGRTLWTDPGLLRSSPTSPWPGASGVLRGVLTDGERALLVVPRSAPGTLRLVAVDLTSGDVRWEREVIDDGQLYLASRGLLLEVDVHAEIVGRDGGGVTVRQDAGTVTAFG